MTIQLLEQQLIQRLQHITTHGELAVQLPKPHRLLRRLEYIEKRFDELENSKPSQDKILISIEKLEKAGVSQLSRRDWKNIAWGMCIQFPTRPQKLIFLATGRDVLDYIKSVRNDLIPSIYIALLFSYFALDKNELNQNSNNWLILREILYNGLADLYVTHKRPRNWMLLLSDYTELLQAQPTKRLSLEFVNATDEQRIPDIADKLHISANSWFWDKLITAAVKSVCNLADGAFVEKIDRLLYLAETNPTYLAQIVAQVLDRYAGSQFRDQIHERLKKMALAQWDNPQYGTAVGWSNVKSDTKMMVIQWFIRADLEAFFKLFTDNADERRFEFWMKYLKKITSSQLFFGKDSYSSQNFRHRQFLQQNRGRYVQLRGGKSSINAFMLQIGNIHIIEFSETGNACYFYGSKPFGIRALTEINDLKNKKAKSYLKALRHAHYWEDEFFSELSALGIYTDS